MLLLKKSEDEQAEISDALFYCPDSLNSDNKKKVKVQTVQTDNLTIDL